MKMTGNSSGLWMFNSDRMNLRRDGQGNLILTNRPEEEEREGAEEDEEIEEIEEIEECEEEDVEGENEEENNNQPCN